MFWHKAKVHHVGLVSSACHLHPAAHALIYRLYKEGMYRVGHTCAIDICSRGWRQGEDEVIAHVPCDVAGGVEYAVACARIGLSFCLCSQACLCRKLGEPCIWQKAQKRCCLGAQREA